MKPGEAHVMRTVEGRADLYSADGYAVGCHENKRRKSAGSFAGGSWKIVVEEFPGTPRDPPPSLAAARRVSASSSAHKSCGLSARIARAGGEDAIGHWPRRLARQGCPRPFGCA